MIDPHGAARALAVAAAIAGPIWLLTDRHAQGVTNSPILALRAAPASPLPARPLFAPSPITGESDAPGAEGAPRLIGIAGRLPDDAVALVRLSDGATRGLRRGESADGWTVAEIAADRVRLTRAGRDHVEILPPTS